MKYIIFLYYILFIHLRGPKDDSIFLPQRINLHLPENSLISTLMLSFVDIKIMANVCMKMSQTNGKAFRKETLVYCAFNPH